MQYTPGAALYCKRDVVYLILKRPLGLYALIDEESKFPKATANSLLEKVRKHLIKYSCIKKEKGREPLFTIQHYAGPVCTIKSYARPVCTIISYDRPVCTIISYDRPVCTIMSYSEN